MHEMYTINLSNQLVKWQNIINPSAPNVPFKGRSASCLNAPNDPYSELNNL